jgi:hypothetical protein
VFHRGAVPELADMPGKVAQSFMEKKWEANSLFVHKQSDVIGMMDFIRTLSPELRELVDDRIKFKVGGDQSDED